MRAVVQRVSRARVTPGGEVGRGLCVLLGVARGDGEEQAARLLVVSQFTLIADTAKGNRPSFAGAARPEAAEPLYERFCAELRALGAAVETGVFGAKMELELVNDGPVTVVLEV